MQARIFYSPGAEEIILTTRGCRITALSGARSGQQIASVDVQAVQLKLAARYNPASITARVHGIEDSFGSLTYRANSATDAVQIFSPGDSAQMDIASGSEIDTRDTSSLFIDGQKVNDYRDARLKLRGEGVRPNRAILASVAGLQLSVHGRFSDLTIQTAGGNDSLLPTLLSKIQGVWLIILGAAVFIMDKLITIYKFVQPGKDN
jgi:hypothetical protein